MDLGTHVIALFISYLLTSVSSLYIVVRCMLNFSELKMVDCLVFWHMQGLAIQNGISSFDN